MHESKPLRAGAQAARGGGGHARQGLMDAPRHVIGFQVTQETRVQNAFDDVANTTYQTLTHGERPFFLMPVLGRGLHSSTSQLNLSRSCH